MVAQNRAGKSTISVTLTVEGKINKQMTLSLGIWYLHHCTLNRDFFFSAVEHQVKPVFVEKLKNVNVKEGARLEMKVRATGNPNPDIVWLKNSDIIMPHKYPKIR